MNLPLFGVGLYTPVEAARLTGVPAGKLSRWLRGHYAKGRHYDRLWTSQVDIGDDRVYLGFRDLMEARTVAAFLKSGLSPQFIRRAIAMARELIDDSHPLSTLRFKTDGRTIFLEVAKEEGAEGAMLIDIVKRQYAFRQIIERSLKDVDFEGISPIRWFPANRQTGIVIDPARSFGQPIDDKSGVATAVLATAAEAEGGIKEAASAWAVDPVTIKRAIAFEDWLKNAA
jgi:uncharacterized protein (DUF433 family)